MTGPYETEQQVRELPAVRAIYDAMHARHRRGVMGEPGCRLLDEACEAASVKVGAYDHRILTWLAGFEPEAYAVVADLITRAHQAGAAVTGERPVTLTAAQAAAVCRALADAEVNGRQRAAAWCADCESPPAGKCTDHMDDLDAADAYRDLTSGLAPVGADHPREAAMRDPYIHVEKPPMPGFGHPAMRVLITEATGAICAARSLGPVLVPPPRSPARPLPYLA